MKPIRLALFALLVTAPAALAAPPKPEGIVEKPGAYAALDSPQCIRAKDDHRLPADSPIIGVARSGEACAYLLRGLAPHRVVNDHLGGPEILVAYDPDSATATAYDPKVEGKALEFDFHGYGDGLMLLSDRGSKSLWNALTGDCVSGPMAGKQLARIPTIVTTLKGWEDLYPDTWTLAAPDIATSPKIEALGAPPIGPDAEKSRTSHPSGSLGENELVLGIPEGGHARAYPIATLARTNGIVFVTRRKLGHSDNSIVLYDPSTGAAAAYDRVVDGQKLSFTPKFRRQGIGFVDSATSSVWDVTGRCVDGPMKGKALEPLGSVQTKWYAWSAAYPKSKVVKVKIH